MSSVRYIGASAQGGSAFCPKFLPIRLTTPARRGSVSPELPLPFAGVELDRRDFAHVALAELVFDLRLSPWQAP